MEACVILKWICDNEVKANPDKFHMVLSEKSPIYLIEVEGEKVFNSERKKLLGTTIDTKMHFNDHVSKLCSKASSKLHALSRISHFMTFEQRKTILNAFILSHFSNCPLVWMFHSRSLNNRINHLHERALRSVYQDSTSTFEDLLIRNESVSIHHRNIQTLVIEMYKVYYKICPKIMN